VNIQLQDVDAQYALPTGAANMSSTLIAGDNLVPTGVRANFVRAKVVSISGDSGVTGANLGLKSLCENRKTSTSAAKKPPRIFSVNKATTHDDS
jgi:hypothetical protein